MSNKVEFLHLTKSNVVSDLKGSLKKTWCIRQISAKTADSKIASSSVFDHQFSILSHMN